MLIADPAAVPAKSHDRETASPAREVDGGASEIRIHGRIFHKALKQLESLYLRH